MSDGFHVDADHLRAHAGHLDAAGEDVGGASGAAGSVHLDAHAFGVLCAPLIPLVQGHEQKTVGLVRDAGAALGRCADGMREMAGDYDGSDAAAEQRFRAFDAALGSR